jgi:endonuclease YncB( thermonuclease family)
MGRSQIMRRRRGRPLGVTRPFGRTLADAVVFVAALGLVLFLATLGGLFDPVKGGPRVIDGDSLTIAGAKPGQGTEVRLHGIDAPEYHQTCLDENGREWACGKEAARFLRGLVEGREVDCRPIDRDRYGRLVADCMAGGMSLNDEMLKAGYAVTYRAISARRASLESEASAAKRGIWRGRFERPETWRTRHRPIESNAASYDEG